MMSEEQLTLWSKKLYEKILKFPSKEGINYVKFLHGLIKRLDNFNDALIVVCGERSSGKSSLALTSALILKHLGLKFDFYQNIFYSANDMDTSIDLITTSEQTVFIYDEMIDIGYSQDAMSRLNKINKKIFTRLRRYRNIYFFCIPHLIDLDKGFRNRLTNFWIEMIDKSKSTVDYDMIAFYASLHKKSAVSTVDPDPWGLEDFQKKFLLKKNIIHKKKRDIFTKFKSFRGFIRCPAVPKEIYQEYNTLAKESIVESGTKIKKELNRPPPEKVYIWKKPPEEL